MRTNGPKANILDSELVIFGCGYFGLMLAIEFDRLNLYTLLYDAPSGTAYNPRANATKARMKNYV